ncbi:hypothetical protein CONLIGDRAFT_686898 [Coniochaeta ligniaria NRRL 30616]|uniref:Uncharacterized protein n=1 Tax=Coniochaeta ligniaria NRRL 30616 TaxID=1408157 RepID=A0A1J7I662_9PEZI|nr:hypothetical protein CONLIGDRAFT_686898 [Coniochaeta ligniaria NRRL 30616]
MPTFLASICGPRRISLNKYSPLCIGGRACKAFSYNPKVKWYFLKSDFKSVNDADIPRICSIFFEPLIKATGHKPFVNLTTRHQGAGRQGSPNLDRGTDARLNIQGSFPGRPSLFRR